MLNIKVALYHSGPQSGELIPPQDGVLCQAELLAQRPPRKRKFSQVDRGDAEEPVAKRRNLNFTAATDKETFETRHKDEEHGGNMQRGKRRNGFPKCFVMLNIAFFSQIL
jgi:hypothetical protein